MTLTYNGALTLFWYSEHSIKALVNGAVTETVFTDETNSITDDFSLIYSDNGYSGVIWTSVQEDESRQIEGILYDKDKTAWSKEVTISSSAADVRYPNGIISEDGTMKIMYNRTGNDGDNAQSDLCIMNLTPSHDLAIENVRYNESDLIPNAEMPVNITLKNNGLLPIESVTVDVGAHQSIVDVDMMPGEDAEITVFYSLPDTIAHETVNISVNITGETENNQEDNTWQLAWGYADAALVMSDLIFDTGHIAVLKITNESYIPANGTLTVRKNDKDGEILDSQDLGTLTNQELQTIRYTVSNNIVEEVPELEKLYFVIETDCDELYYVNNYDYISTASGVGNEGGGSYLHGDVNADKVIDMQDVLLIYQYFRGNVEFTEVQRLAADVNGDSAVDMQDVLLVYQYFRGNITRLSEVQ